MEAKHAIEINASEWQLIKDAIEQAHEIFQTMASGFFVTYEAALNQRIEILAEAKRIIEAKS